MCICLNCFHLSYCTMYKIISLQHKEKADFLIKNFFLYPQSPVIYSIISYSSKGNCLSEWDINECLSFQEKPGNWLFQDLANYIYLNYDLLYN